MRWESELYSNSNLRVPGENGLGISIAFEFDGTYGNEVEIQVRTLPVFRGRLVEMNWEFKFEL